MGIHATFSQGLPVRFYSKTYYKLMNNSVCQLCRKDGFSQPCQINVKYFIFFQNKTEKSGYKKCCPRNLQKSSTEHLFLSNRNEGVTTVCSRFSNRSEPVVPMKMWPVRPWFDPLLIFDLLSVCRAFKLVTREASGNGIAFIEVSLAGGFNFGSAQHYSPAILLSLPF